jgi:hypothetical protein
MIKSRPDPKKPSPVTEEELDQFEQVWADFLGDDEEVIRRTTRGMPPVDINYIEFGDD